MRSVDPVSIWSATPLIVGKQKNEESDMKSMKKVNHDLSAHGIINLSPANSLIQIPKNCSNYQSNSSSDIRQRYRENETF